MSRGNTSHAGRCVAVWLVATAAVLGTAAVADPLAALTATAWTQPFDVVLVDAAGLVLLAATVRLWLVATLTVAEVARTGGVRGRDGLTRRLVAAACGAAVVAGAAGPVHADSRNHTDTAVSIAGLPLPERAEGLAASPAPVAPRTPTPTAHVSTPDRVVVGPGDSLWAIAARTLPPGARPAAVDARWREIWAANRATVGADPDLILPGQRLRLPETHD